MADRCIRSHVAGSNGQFYIGVPKGPPIYTISGYISLRRGIATIPMAGRTTLAATATVGRRFRTTRAAVATCTSPRRACTRCTTAIGRTGLGCVLPKNLSLYEAGNPLNVNYRNG